MTDPQELSRRLRARAASESDGGDEAAAERAMMGMEAAADVWAERVNLNGMIANLVHINRLDPKAPSDVREKFIKRQFEQIDALVRQSYLEGWFEGGLSRKAYDVGLDQSVVTLIDAQAARIAELERALTQIAAMKTMPDDKLNTFTLAMAHTVARKALSNE